MPELLVPAHFTPREYQQELFDARKDGYKRIMARWCRRGGKDTTCYCIMVSEMLQRVGSYYYFFPTYQQGRKALWEDMENDGFRKIHHFPPELMKRVNNQEMMFEAPNGSVFRIVGLDNVDTVVGTNPVGCVFSEFALQDPRGWDYISPILAANGGWAIFNSTPRGMNHMYEMEEYAKNSDNWFVSVKTIDDIGEYEKRKDEIKERLHQKGKQFVDQEYYVSYNSGSTGSVYNHNITKCREEGRVGEFPYNSNYPVYTFWDLGYHDPTSIWFVQYIQDKIVFIDYWEGKEKDIPDIMRDIRSKPYDYMTHWLPHDAENNYGLGQTKRDLIESCLRSNQISGLTSVLKTSSGTSRKPPVAQGIDSVQTRFARYHFNVGTCSEALKKLSLYHYRHDDKRNIFLPEPVHDDSSHCADALRLEATVAQEDYTSNYSSYNQHKTFYETYDPFEN